MKKGNQIKKFLETGMSIVICIVLIITSFSSAVIVQDERVRSSTVNETFVVWVDDDFNESTPGWQYDHFDKIQDGINAVQENGTVYVFSGNYKHDGEGYEHVVVNKRINLIGEDKNSTIIDGDDCADIVKITADWVNISGFTIQNSTCLVSPPAPKPPLAGVKILSNHSTTTGNIITDTNFAIIIWHSSHNTISGNTITNSNVRGIWVEVSANTIISGNTCAGNGDYGIYVSESPNTTITDNTFELNGITIMGPSLYHWITHTIENNTANGKPIRCYQNMNGVIVPNDTDQVILINCTNFTIQNFNFSDIDSSVQLGFSSNNEIVNNTILSRTKGICLTNSFTNTIVENKITDSIRGISLWYSSNNNNISNNIITRIFERSILLCLSNHNTIFGNHIVNGHGRGIRLLHSDYNTLERNVLTKGDEGISLSWSDNNNVIENVITASGSGVSIRYSQYNTITRNTLVYNKEGIWIHGSKYNSITTNTIANNNIVGILMEYCYFRNNVTGNTITNNSKYGILLLPPNHYQLISNNLISGSLFGILIPQYGWGGCSNYGLIYHNKFFNNTQNAYDQCTNYWDNGYPSGGNYWDDYDGGDEYSGEGQDEPGSDGMGDTPYSIPGGSNQDNYPLMNPWDENPPVANFSYSTDNLSVTFDASSSYDRDGEIVTWLWDFGDGIEGAGMIVEHVYPESEIYDVTLTVIDDDGYEGNITKQIEVEDGGYEFETTLILGRITNMDMEDDVITFDAVRIRCITFFPFTFNVYHAGEQLTISKDYLGWVGEKIIFAICDTSF